MDLKILYLKLRSLTIVLYSWTSSIIWRTSDFEFVFGPEL